MRKMVFALLMACGTLVGNAQGLSGSLVDELGMPVGFANVVLLSLPDSTMVQGTITDEQGRFAFAETQGHRLIRISCLGYVTVTTMAAGASMEVVMKQDSRLLEEVVVRGHRPAYKLTGEGLQTSVQGTVLSKLGTAEDVLAHVPGMQKKGEAYEVFGKGTPVIYINGREMRNPSELDQLKSEDIKSVELITHPGAKYDASVKAVVKIVTKAAVGEGLGGDVRSGYEQWEYAGLTEQLNWNYRQGKLDLFGTLYYRDRTTRVESDLNQLVRADTLWQQENLQRSRSRQRTNIVIAGVNYAVNENHSLGVKYKLKTAPDMHAHTWFATDMTADGAPYDHLENTIEGCTSTRPSHLLNVYYQGSIGKTTVDFSADYLQDRESEEARYEEDSEQKEDRVVTSFGRVKNRLWAAKLTVGRPLLGGNVVVGAEYSRTRRNDDYLNPEGYVPTSNSELAERHVSPFVEYSVAGAMGQLTAGLRYEWVDFDYSEGGKPVADQSRTFGNLFPSLSWGATLGKVQLQASYAAKTRRPSYSQLSNNVTYANRFTWQAGNPTLKHETVHNVSLAAVWQCMQFSLDYKDRRDAIIYWGEQVENDPAVTFISFKNLSSLKSISAFWSLAPRWGIWSPQLSVGMEKQWLEVQTAEDSRPMHAPMWMGGLSNLFNGNRGWVFAVDMSLQGKGDMENCSMTRNVFTVDASVTKSFLKDRLSVKLDGTDLFAGSRTGNRLFFYQMTSLQHMKLNNRKLSLTIRYKWNATRNKYKGVHAAGSELDRL